jgi:hypothetical protein
MGRFRGVGGGALGIDRLVFAAFHWHGEMMLDLLEVLRTDRQH